MLSLGIDCDLAFWIASRSRGFIAGSGDPILAATVISRASFENIFERTASCRPLRCMMFLNCEWPAMKHLIFALVLDWPPYKTLPRFRPEGFKHARKVHDPIRNATPAADRWMPVRQDPLPDAVPGRWFSISAIARSASGTPHRPSAKACVLSARSTLMSDPGLVRVSAAPASAGAVQECQGWFCPDCGVRIWHGTEDSPEINIKAGTLDDTSWLVPAGHIWTRSMQPFFRPGPDELLYEDPARRQL
jgi:hypothetical protein